MPNYAPSAGPRRIPGTAKALIARSFPPFPRSGCFQTADLNKIGGPETAAAFQGSAREAHLVFPCKIRGRVQSEKRAYLLLKSYNMRDIKLSGREAAVVRAIGFAESMLGAEILDSTRMEPEDVGDTLNGLIAAGFIETIPYAEQIDLAEMPSTAFEVNPAYVHELRVAIARR